MNSLMPEVTLKENFAAVYSGLLATTHERSLPQWTSVVGFQNNFSHDKCSTLPCALGIRGLYGYREWPPDFSYTLLLLTNGFVNPRQAYGLEFIGKNDSRSFVRN